MIACSHRSLRQRILLAYAAFAACLVAPGAFAAPQTTSPEPQRPWVCAYYLSGDADSGRLPPEAIDFSAVSHLIHFGIFPNADGTVGPPKGSITSEQSARVIALAHAAGSKVLVCMGTDEDSKPLRLALADAVRPTLVHNLVQFVIDRGYDGLDLDMEPVLDTDVPAYTVFVHDLRAALDAAKPGLLLTAAVASEPAMFARIQDQLDRIDLMTYDDSGPWPGNKSWYNSSLYGAGREKMNKTDPYASVDDTVDQYLKAGVRPEKIGIGVAFYGYIWSGITAPKQNIAGVTSADVDDGADYSMIMDRYYLPSLYHWDDQAKAPYLSIDAPSRKDRKFISYDDDRLCTLKMQYVRKRHLGGVIIWELGAGYRPYQPAGRRDVLLQAVKRGLTEDSVPGQDR